MKRILSLLLSLCLLTACVGALAEGGVNATLYQPSDDDSDRPYIQSAAALGDVIYVLTNRSLDQWKVGDAEPVTLMDNRIAYTAEEINAIKDEGGIVANLLFTDGANVFALSPTGVVWQVTGTPDGKPVVSVQLAWDEMRYDMDEAYESYRTLYDPKVMDGVLYGLYADWEVNNGLVNVYRWTLATGEKLETYKATTVKSIEPYKDGQFISKIFDEANSWDAATQTQRTPKIGTFDPATGELVELMDTPEYNTCGVRYNADTDTVYYVSGTKVYSVDSAFAAPKISAYLPTQIWDDGCTMLVNGSYVVANYNGLLLRELDPANIGDGALTIYGDYGSDAHQAFVAENPSVAVTCSDDYYTSLEEFTNAMVSDTKVTDVLRLDSTYSPLNRLIAKGYAQDLTSDDELVDYVESTYPDIAANCFKDGKLYAVPISMYATSVGYYKETWTETLGLTEDDLPKTMYELLDFIENWMYDYGEEHADIRLFDNTEIKTQLVNIILEQYVAYYDKLGEPLDFDTELYRKLMTKLDGIDFTEIEPAEGEDTDSDEFWSRPCLFTQYASLTYPSDMDNNTVPMVLPLDEGVEPVIPADMNVLIINPRTTRLEQAMAYLRCYTKHLDEQSAKIVMFPDNNEPVLNKYFESNVKAWQEAVDDYKKQLETAQPEDVANIQSDIDYFTDLLNNTDKYRYSVTAEAITNYREKCAPYLHVMGQNPLSTWNKDGENELWSQIQQYTQGAITLDEFIKNVNQRIRLMQLEDQ